MLLSSGHRRGKPEGDDGSDAEGALERGRIAVEFHDGLDDGEPEARALRMGMRNKVGEAKK